MSEPVADDEGDADKLGEPIGVQLNRADCDRAWTAYCEAENPAFAGKQAWSVIAQAIGFGVISAWAFFGHFNAASAIIAWVAGFHGSTAVTIFRSRKAWRTQAAIYWECLSEVPRQLDLDELEEGVVFTSGAYRFEYPWLHVKHLLADEYLWVIVNDSGSMAWVPAESFDTEESFAQFKRRMAQSYRGRRPTGKGFEVVPLNRSTDPEKPGI